MLPGRNLEEINLRQNKLRELPRGFSSLVNLKVADLSHNQFTELGDEFGKLRALQS